MQAIQVIRFLTVLCRRGGYPYWAYDSFARANADALGTTEARGPLGLVRRRFAWTTIGGDLDISGGTVVGGDAQANVVPNPGFEALDETAAAGGNAKDEALPESGGAFAFRCITSGQDLFGLVKVENAYTPVSGEVFTFRLHLLQD